MKIFDKAQWHIDAGEDSTEVISKFKAVFQFLDKNGFLSGDGKEILEFGIDSSVSLNERMVSKAGAAFLEIYYDAVINFSSSTIGEALEQRFLAQK